MRLKIVSYCIALHGTSAIYLLCHLVRHPIGSGACLLAAILTRFEVQPMCIMLIKAALWDLPRTENSSDLKCVINQRKTNIYVCMCKV